MSSLPHQMNIGWRVVRTSRTVTRRLCGQVRGGPSEVFDQSNPRVRAPISPPSARKSPNASLLITRNLTRTFVVERIAGTPQSTMAGFEFSRGISSRFGVSAAHSLNPNFVLDNYANQNYVPAQPVPP